MNTHSLHRRLLLLMLIAAPMVVASEVRSEVENNPHYDSAFAKELNALPKKCDEEFANVMKSVQCVSQRTKALEASGRFRGTRQYCERHYLGGSVRDLRLKWIEIRNDWQAVSSRLEAMAAFESIKGMRYKEDYQEELDCVSDELKKRGAHPDRRNPRDPDWMNMSVDEFQARFPEGEGG